MSLEKRSQLESLLNKHNIQCETTEHPEVFTVEAMLPHLTNLTGAACKNLFLKDKKKNLYLLSCVHDAEVKLNDIAKAVNAPGGLRFADEQVLEASLGVTQGCVTALALHVDESNKVKFLCDKRLLDGTYDSVNFHPMVNSATMTLSIDNFKKYLDITNHEPVIIDI